MLRGALLHLATQQRVYRFLMAHGLLRALAWRYVAGEELADGVAVARALNARGLGVSLDHLGENVATADEARRAVQAYLAALEAIARERIDGYVSLKLTQLGLDVSREVCRDHLRRILDQARARGGIFVRLDMESSAYTGRTLDLHAELWRQGYRDVGVVLQSYLYRTPADLEREIELGARVRLCKGAYLEPPEIAWPDKASVDASYARLAERLLADGNDPALATHDERLVRHAQDFARRNRIAPDRFEFQMLYGVRRDLQTRLVEQGYRVRVYVPYGRQWYPYLVRRLAERPANLGFFLRALVREAVAQRGDGRAQAARGSSSSRSRWRSSTSRFGGRPRRGRSSNQL